MRTCAGARTWQGDRVTARANRLLLVLPSLERGGGEHVVLELARAFVAAGREVHVAVLLGGGPLRTKLPDGAVLHELVADGHAAKGFALAWRAFPKLVLLLRTLKPDAVLSTITGTNLLTVLACTRARGGTRVVLREASSLVNARSVLKRQSMRWLYRRADAIVAVSTGVADDLRRLGVPDGRIRVIHNPVDRQRLRRLADTGPALPKVAGTPYVIAVGRLTEAKDYPTLLRAYASSKLRGTHRLVIVGDGELRERLCEIVRELGIGDRVVLAGDMDNPFRVLAGAALLVLSSRWEGYPNVLLEAMALGVPVVATDCPHGPREILEDGRYGQLAPVGDAAALARAMDAGFEQPPACAEEVAKRHDVGSVASCYLGVLDGVSEGRQA